MKHRGHDNIEHRGGVGGKGHEETCGVSEEEHECRAHEGGANDASTAPRSWVSVSKQQDEPVKNDGENGGVRRKKTQHEGQKKKNTTRGSEEKKHNTRVRRKKKHNMRDKTGIHANTFNKTRSSRLLRWRSLTSTGINKEHNLLFQFR